MAPGIQIVNKGKDGNIKQDYAAYREDGKARVIEVDKQKAIEEKKSK